MPPALLITAFTGWWLKDLRVEAAWEPEWPPAVRVAGEAVEKLVPGPDGEISEADRARATERARWKAYHFAQLRAAERLGDLEISSRTTVRDLGEIDQVLRASYEGTLRAAAEVESESSVEVLEDAARARVVVEIPAATLRSFKALVAEAIRAGRISVERRPPKPPEPAEPATVAGSVPPTPVAAAGPVPPEPPAAAGAPAVAAGAATGPSAAEVAAVSQPAAAPVATVTRRPPPRSAAPAHTGAAVFLGSQASRLGATPVIYDAAGSELGSALDLPPERLTAGFHLASPDDAEAVHRRAGSSPRRFEATISLGDLFLTVALDSEEVLRFKEWLGDGKVVLVLGDPE